jgi:nucleoside-diphosphate-sugar epimerase
LFIEGSILNRSKLTEIFRGCDCIIHIAAWHGIHEDRGEKDAYDFFDLNVRGTFEVFEAAASAGIGKVIFISTTSVYRPDTRYGSSKILAELIAEDYRKHRLMNVVALRPRGVYSLLGPRSLRQIQRLGALVLEGRGAYR